MSRYRRVHVRIWGDEKFRALSRPQPNGQSLFMYLLTGPHTGVMPGLASIGEAALAESLRWPIEQFRSAYQEIDSRGMVEADWTAPLVFLPNGMKYNPPESPNVVRAWRGAFEDLPDCALKDKAFKSFEGFIEGLTEAFRKAWVRSSLIKNMNKSSNKSSNKKESAAIITPTLRDRIDMALNGCRILGRDPRVRSDDFWYALLGAHEDDGVDPIAQLKKAETWMVANPRRAPKRDFARFFSSWCERASNG